MRQRSDAVTELLLAWSNGDLSAREKLVPLVYDELHQLARRRMRRERPGHTLQTTALINEAYFRLVSQRNVRWQNRAHFLAVAGQVMRRILVDHARSQHYQKRRGRARVLPIDEIDVLSPGRAAEVVALDDALKRLQALDERKCRVVELRFFAGLSVEETAKALDVSPTTVKRDWTVAKAWLYREVTTNA